MPAPATTTELLDALSRSGLLAPPLFDAYALRLGRASPPPDPAAALRVLLDDRAVTPFQARYLSDGRYKGFFLGGKYKLLAHLGSGGVGEVYLGEQLPLHRLVAIKLLKLSPNAGDAAGATQRFYREARAVAALSHPNIAQLYDVNHAGPTPYMVMEYVDGTNLHAVVGDNRPLSVDRAVNYTVQAARGLDHAHQNGLVHRDVKPGNLVLDRTGVVRLLDLGLARYHTDAAKNENLTAKYDNNNLIGTADFMAPEQTRDSSAVDARADVYSLGCTLYFLLTGRAPFHGGSVAQKLLWHQVKSPPPADALRPDVPRELVAVLDRMMAKDRDRRVQTAAEVGRALAPWYAATLDPPPAGEMPEQKSEHYRLGLVDAAPTHEPVTRLTANGAVPTQPASDTLVAVPPDSTAEAVGPPTAAPPPRRSGRRTTIFVAVQLALVAATVAGTTYLNSLSNRGLVTDPVRKSPDPDGKLVPRETLQIGGSPLAEPLVRAWGTAYQRATGTGVQFAAVGSDAGVGGLLASAYDIAWTDSPNGFGSAARAGPAGKTLTRVPLAVTAVVPAYNVPGVGPGLRLSGPVLADIALGALTAWDDPRVRELNPGVPLPARSIRFVARSDRGGATAAWTDFLSDASPAWTRGPGRVDTLAGWTVGTPVAGNDEMIRSVAQTEGAVGYAEWSAQVPAGVNFALVRNRAGRFAASTPQTIRAAGDGPDAYPIVGSACAVFDAGMEDKGRLVLALDFLAWCLTDGQTLAAELDFVPLPTASAAAAAQTLKQSRGALPNP